MTRGRRNDAKCSVVGCTVRAWGNGLCQKHYSRLRRTGTTDDPPSLAELFWSHVEKTDTCWLWTGHVTASGYGSTTDEQQRTLPAHRRAFMLCGLEIPDGLQLDHLCRVRHCVNPDHLEPVTAQINTLRGESLQAMNAIKTHCPKGHRYTQDNTYVDPRGSRRCRECRKLQRSVRSNQS